MEKGMRFGVIGWPLGHSLSPVLHNWAFAALGLPHRYEAWPVEPDGLAAFMEQVRQEPLGGLSVTIPHKEAVAPLLDEISDLARAVGAVNTVYWRDGRLWGHNSDVAGFLEGLAGAGALRCASALVLGAGGAARAALAGLRDAGIPRRYVSGRSLEKAQALGSVLEAEALPWAERAGCGAELVVNATPLGMRGASEAESPWPGAAFRRGMWAYDLVYNPLRTRFLREAEEAGCGVVDGLAMFVGQAGAQFQLWTGLRFDPRAARVPLLEVLGGS